MESLPTINVIIPTLNEEQNLKKCLEAIFRQDYDKDKIKVTVVDGGSIDKTIEIAKKLKCEILNNEEKFAEPGVYKGILHAKTDLCCVLAIDNIIVNEKDFFRNLVIPFQRSNVIGAFPLVIYSQHEPAINKYITTRAEPFSEFIYANACNSRTFDLVYPVVVENETYTIFDFKKDDAPSLLALAQGFTFRKDSFIRNVKNKYDDLLPILELIEKGGKIAYVRKANIYHLQIMSLRMFVQKFRWRIKRNLITKSFNDKVIFFTLRRRIRRILWVGYALSIFLPLLYALYCCIKEKKLFYFYHFICTMILLYLISVEFLHYKYKKLLGQDRLGTYK